MLRPSMPRIVFVSLIALLGVLLVLPNFPTARQWFPSFLPAKPITLGLDLQGGAFFRLEVDTSNVLKDYYDGIYDVAREELRQERIRVGRPLIADDKLIIRLSSASELDKAFAAVKRIDSQLVVEKQGENITMFLPEEPLLARKERVIEQSVEVVRRRVDSSGLTEPIIRRQGFDRIELQLPGVRSEDIERIKGNISKGGRLEFRQVSENAADASNFADYEVLNGDPEAGEGDFEYIVNRHVELTGDMIEDASLSFDPQTNAPQVAFRLDSKGARRFSDYTAAHQGERFAIVLDNKVVSAPVIQDTISVNGVINGNFTVESANQLAVLIRAGALPAPLKFLEERSVGPSLGQDSINAGLIACLVGLAAVMLFMLIYYGLFGLFANLALLVNMVLMFGLLTFLPATLTLPGIAGIVLTVGMAIDANVLVFERMREIYKKGKAVSQTIVLGYQEAMSTIIDANLTTLIATFLLYYFGSGPVKGFAVTLGIGILCSMFAVLFFTRMLLGLWCSPKQKHLPIA